MVVSKDITLSKERVAEMRAAERFIFAVTEQGFGKRSSSLEYPVVGRGGKGVTTIAVDKRTGPMAASFEVAQHDEIMVMMDTGEVDRMPVKNITVAPRNGMGHKIITTRDTEHIISVEKAPIIADNVEEQKLLQAMKREQKLVKKLDFGVSSEIRQNDEDGLKPSKRKDKGKKPYVSAEEISTIDTGPAVSASSEIRRTDEEGSRKNKGKRKGNKLGEGLEDFSVSSEIKRNEEDDFRKPEGKGKGKKFREVLEDFGVSSKIRRNEEEDFGKTKGKRKGDKLRENLEDLGVPSKIRRGSTSSKLTSPSVKPKPFSLSMKSPAPSPSITSKLRTPSTKSKLLKTSMKSKLHSPSTTSKLPSPSMKSTRKSSKSPREKGKGKKLKEDPRESFRKPKGKGKDK